MEEGIFHLPNQISCIHHGQQKPSLYHPYIHLRIILQLSWWVNIDRSRIMWDEEDVSLIENILLYYPYFYVKVLRKENRWKGNRKGKYWSLLGWQKKRWIYFLNVMFLLQHCIRFCHGNHYNHSKLVCSAADVVVRFVGFLSRFCFYLEGKSVLRVMMRKCLPDPLREGMV